MQQSQNFETAFTALEALLGGARVSRKGADLALHGQNETYFAPTPPDAVAWPESTAEVSEIMKICHAHGVPVTPWGAGSSLEGHALALRGGVSLDMTRMDQILSTSPEDRLATVQPASCASG